jgi:hypothetical protein
MTAAHAHAPALRLVNSERALRTPPLPRAHSAAWRIRSENRAAARIDPRDARWVVAVSAARSIEGGLAAILPPDRRRRLISMAVALGLREFDANLVIAIVQDAARAGLPALGRTTEERLGLVKAAATVRERSAPASPQLLLLASGVLAAGVFVALLAWIA